MGEVEGGEEKCKKIKKWNERSVQDKAICASFPTPKKVNNHHQSDYIKCPHPIQHNCL